MLRYRLLFGPLMIALLLVLLFLDNQLDTIEIGGTVWERLLFGRTYLPAGLLMAFAMTLLVIGAAWELTTMLKMKGVSASRALMAVSAVTGCWLMYIVPYETQASATLGLYASTLVVLVVVSAVRVAVRRKPEGAMLAISAPLLAFMYLGVLLGFLLAIRRWHSAWIIAGIVLITKSCDIGAYFTGRSLGKHKLIPWLSPGKTWEGLIGGLVLSGLVAVGLTAWGNAAEALGRYGPNRDFTAMHIDLWFAALVGVLFGFVGQVGDLMASLFKRDAGIKDSGGSIPGFGGVIDVIDSPILVAPLAYWAILLGEALSDPA